MLSDARQKVKCLQQCLLDLAGCWGKLHENDAPWSPDVLFVPKPSFQGVPDTLLQRADCELGQTSAGR